MRAWMKAVLPVRLRRFLRRKAREAPARLRDLPRDAVCAVFPRAFGGPLPPPGLRARVGGLSRTEFAMVGREGSAAILRAFVTTRRPGREYARWLDFGCGCEREQFAWLEELRRILAPCGLLIATTHGPSLSQSCPGLAPGDLATLAQRGFLAVDPGGTFNERSTFHASAYLAKAWGRGFLLRAHEPHGFIGYQDLSVWEKQ